MYTGDAKWEILFTFKGNRSLMHCFLCSTVRSVYFWGKFCFLFLAVNSFVTREDTKNWRQRQGVRCKNSTTTIIFELKF